MDLGLHSAVRIYRWFKGERFDLVQPDAAWVTSVSIRITAGAANTISVAIEMSYESAMYWLEQDLFDIGNVLEARVGYSNGRWTPWYSGIMNAPGVTLTSNGLTGTLTATGAGAAALVNSSGKTWDGETVWGVVRSMSRKYNFAVEAGPGVEEKLSIPVPNPQQSGANDWLYLRGLLRVQGCDMYFGSGFNGRGTLFVRAWDEALRQQPKRVFTMRRQIDLRSNQYPAISMTVMSSPGAVFNAASTRGVFSQFLDEDGFVRRFDASPKTLNVTEEALGEGSVQTGVIDGEIDQDSGAIRDVQIEPDSEDAGTIVASIPEGSGQGLVDSMARDAMMGFPGMEISVQSLGEPEVLPYELQELRGASKRFDGPYMTFEVLHEVSSAGYTTTWTGRRNAFTLPIDAMYENDAVNEQPPEGE